MNRVSYLVEPPAASHTPAWVHSSCALHRKRIHDPSVSMFHSLAACHRISISCDGRPRRRCAWGVEHSCYRPWRNCRLAHHFRRRKNLFERMWASKSTATVPVRTRRAGNCPWLVQRPVGPRGVENAQVVIPTDKELADKPTAYL